MAWITTKVLGYALAVALALGAIGTGWFWIQNLRAQEGLAKAQKRAQEASNRADLYEGSLKRSEAAAAALIEAEKKARAVAESRAAVAEKQQKEWKKRYDALDKALQDSADWASTPIPDSVLNAIGAEGSSGSDKGGSGQTPVPSDAGVSGE